MYDYEYKNYSATIRVKNGSIVEGIIRKAAEAEEELKHSLDYALFSNPYRKYRRGKNRCNRCGVRLNGKEN